MSAADGGPVGRARGFAGRAVRTPGTIAEIARALDATDAQLAAALDEVRVAFARLEQLGWDGRHDTRGGVEAVGNELHRLREHVDAVGERAAALDGTVVAQANALQRSMRAPDRARAAADLQRSLGAPPDLVPGLSTFTPSWEHGELLADAVRSAQAVLDLLPADEQGEILVLDDASADATPAVTAALAAEDSRIRVIRADENLGLAHARNTLLHTARTRHALQLDADNVARAEGILDLYRTARATGAAFTDGTLAQVDVDGSWYGTFSNEPPTPAAFRSNYIDALGVADVAVFREIGGWPVDPLLEHVHDWAALHLLARQGHLIAFVPTLAALYRQMPTGLHKSIPDPRPVQERIARLLDPMGHLRGEDPLADVAAIAHHPDTGTLWATPAAVARRPDLAPGPPPAPPARPAPSHRILLISTGGVANLGDDAITAQAIVRARAAFGTDVAVDVLSDGPPARAWAPDIRWLQPLHMAVHGLTPAQLGALPEALRSRAEAAGVGSARWRPFAPEGYDAAVFLGGGFSSHWTEGTLVPRALVAAALRAAGVPYACSGQGYAFDEADTDVLAVLLAGAAVVGCRDEETTATARSLAPGEPPIVTFTGDDALGLAPTDPLGRPAGSRPRLAVTLRSADYVGDPADDPVRRWALAADALAADRGWDVVGVALNDQPPEPEIATLARLRATTALRARWHLVQCGAEPGRLVAAMAGAEAAAVQSYHAAVFALQAGVPAVLGASSPYYVTKAEGLAGLAGLPRSLAVTDPDAMAAALDEVTAALADRPLPLADATRAVDSWWAALPAALGLTTAAGRPLSSPSA